MSRRFTTRSNASVPPTTEWLAEIRAAIEACDNFLFVLSPESASSAICRLELEHAIQHRKRLIPIVSRTVAPDQVPPSIASLNWIFFDAEHKFDESFKTLVTALDTDFDLLAGIESRPTYTETEENVGQPS